MCAAELRYWEEGLPVSLGAQKGVGSAVRELAHSYAR
jgi:hypothetical protein